MTHSFPTRRSSDRVDTPPQVGVISQYVKDMSFENPNAPAVYQWQTQPKIEVQFNIGSQKVGDDVHEVVLRIEVTAQSDDRTAFQVERSEEHTSELQSLMRISYAVFCLKQNK